MVFLELNDNLMLGLRTQLYICDDFNNSKNLQ
jgi:hypothetical protein